MSHHDAHDDHAPNVKLYLGVFLALMVLTFVTVWISHFHLEKHEAIALGLAVATVKASLVAAVFMHLWGEKKLIFYTLGLTVFLGAFMVIGLIDSRLTAHNRGTPVDVAAQQPHHAAAGHEAAPEGHEAPAHEAPKAGEEAKAPAKAPAKKAGKPAKAAH